MTSTLAMRCSTAASVTVTGVANAASIPAQETFLQQHITCPRHTCWFPCRLLAFLREEEERERLEEIERLRPIGTAVGPYMEYR